MKELSMLNAVWHNQPAYSQVDANFVSMVTNGGTDLWQNTFYNFVADNAPALLLESSENFTFTCHAEFSYHNRYDQCGIILYINSENWFKASLE
ncbi:MAG: DUF1349 domain-containing protein, partial [Lentisphaeria bacterium]